MREQFKNTILGILFLGVASSLIATCSWELGSYVLKTRAKIEKLRAPAADAIPPDSTQVAIDSKSHSIPEAIHDYNRAFLELSLSAGGPGAVERLYESAKVLIGQMMVPNAAHVNYIDQIKPSEVQALAQQLHGLAFHRDETVGIGIDSQVFLSLSKKNGTSSDVEFFQNWRLTYTDSNAWPRWVTQKTDFSGCVNYDDPEVINIFRKWKDYAANHPGDYADEVTEQLKSIRGLFTEHSCACGDKATVDASFQQFLGSFPDDSSAAKAKKRLINIQQGLSNIRFSCTSG